MSTTTTPSDTKGIRAAITALTDIVDTARTRSDRARKAADFGLAREFDSIAHTLDAARTRLVEDGDEYIDAAWAFVTAGRRALANRHKLAAYLDAIAKAAR